MAVVLALVLQFVFGFTLIQVYTAITLRCVILVEIRKSCYILIWNYMFRPIMAIVRFIYRLRGVYIS